MTDPIGIRGKHVMPEAWWFIHSVVCEQLNTRKTLGPSQQAHPSSPGELAACRDRPHPNDLAGIFCMWFSLENVTHTTRGTRTRRRPRQAYFPWLLLKGETALHESWGQVWWRTARIPQVLSSQHQGVRTLGWSGRSGWIICCFTLIFHVSCQILDKFDIRPTSSWI